MSLNSHSATTPTFYKPPKKKNLWCLNFYFFHSFNWYFLEMLPSQPSCHNNMLVLYISTNHRYIKSTRFIHITSKWRGSDYCWNKLSVSHQEEEAMVVVWQQTTVQSPSFLPGRFPAVSVARNIILSTVPTALPQHTNEPYRDINLSVLKKRTVHDSLKAVSKASPHCHNMLLVAFHSPSHQALH